MALLIANSVKYGLVESGVPAAVVKTRVKDLAERLENLGAESFEVTSLVNRPRADAEREARRVIRSVGADGLLLIYYFGHGVLGPGNELYFFGPGSEEDDFLTMLSFSELTRPIKLTNVSQCVFLLDCCYGGAGEVNLQADLAPSTKYYLLAAASSREKAFFEFGVEIPYGYFSKALLGAFRDRTAAELDGKVPLGKLKAFLEGQMPAWQKLYPRDGGLADTVLFSQRRELQVPRGVNTWISPKTSYKKIHALAKLLSSKAFASSEKLYAFIAQRKPTPAEFLTPLKTGHRTVEYGLIGPESFERYVEICRRLGIVGAGEPLRLTSVGKRMVRSEGRDFNGELLGLLKPAWGRYGLTIEDLQDVVVRRVQSGWVPSAAQLYADIYSGKGIRIGRQTFDLLLALTGYVGALQYSRDRVFFVAVS